MGYLPNYAQLDNYKAVFICISYVNWITPRIRYIVGIISTLLSKEIPSTCTTLHGGH